MERPVGGSPGMPWESEAKQQQLDRLRESLQERDSCDAVAGPQHPEGTRAKAAGQTVVGHSDVENDGVAADGNQKAAGMPQAVREALLRVLWQAVHDTR